MLLFGLARSSYTITLMICSWPPFDRTLTLIGARFTLSLRITFFERGWGLFDPVRCMLLFSRALRVRDLRFGRHATTVGLSYWSTRYRPPHFSVIFYICVLPSPPQHFDYRLHHPSRRGFASCPVFGVLYLRVSFLTYNPVCLIVEFRYFCVSLHG